LHTSPQNAIPQSQLNTGLKIARAMTAPIDQRAYRQPEWSRAGLIFRCGKCHSENPKQGVTISYAQDGLGQSQIKDRFDD